ncbi:diacylglycerol/lipid kinase family protein [Haliangium ochraceum]|uniref:DAGKc domain-containing protein n=1 Tax=Haliangium ochraceum (strain DSM 14365 / JCM 11303 / SMP-2) TaxID=502025 RepID=D0LIS7_HALO1|nr:diacylglycerol kinase family protein [Haliangium ochraceum]ACY12956.1 hypothetical protein Hoch_0315 [Haliangium ochraceum DSM 14365]
MQIGVITNPKSRKNRGRPERADRLQSILGSFGEVHETDSVDSIKPILRDFLRKRARYWVADGGDGALHWMLRMGMEVLDEEEFIGTEMPLPLLPTRGGTIDFVANNVGIQGNAESILSSLRSAVERGAEIEEAVVDSMLIDAVEVTDEGEVPFRTYGFACAAGGVGQRFFANYYKEDDPNPRTIVKIVSKMVASVPLAMTPLRRLRGLPWHLDEFAREVFAPAQARVSIDGMILPEEQLDGIHIASMAINLGNVFRLFNKAETPGLMHAIVGSASPINLMFNLPRMYSGKELRGRQILDRPCRELTVEATGDELLAPVVDGEYYPNLRKITFKLGPRVRIPRVVASRTSRRH